jgi:hypothetical protein
MLSVQRLRQNQSSNEEGSSMARFWRSCIRARITASRTASPLSIQTQSTVRVTRARGAVILADLHGEIQETERANRNTVEVDLSRQLECRSLVHALIEPQKGARERSASVKFPCRPYANHGGARADC